MPHSYSSIFTHIVFATENRLPVIDESLEQRLFPYLGGIVRQLEGKVYAINAAGDHVHLLAELPPTIALAEAIGKVKGCSSKWIHETFPSLAGSGWQRGYSAFSVSRSNVSKVAGYIERQKIHHRRVTFEDEYRALLKKHGIEVDDRFLWT